MKLVPFILLLLLPPVLSSVQEKDGWRRVFKYEDGTVVELDTGKVTFGPKQTGKVRMRVVWAKPQSTKGLNGRTYKTHLETLELKCTERLLRRAELTLLDAQGSPVYTYEGELTDEWESVKPKTLLHRVFDPACMLLDEKRRDPDQEP